MPFGLKNAPDTFQRAVDIILSRVKWKHAPIYLDDVIVYSTTVEAHFEHIREVLTLLQAAEVSLELRKCSFFETSVDYLGHVVRPGNLEVAMKNCESIKQAKGPANQTELRSLLGMCNVHLRLVPNFACAAAPLNRKLTKGEPYASETLTDKEYEALQNLKDKIVRPPILALPRHGYPYALDTDGCEYQVGCTLLQQQPNADKTPIGYWSRSLQAAERNYSTTEK